MDEIGGFFADDVEPSWQRNIAYAKEAFTEFTKTANAARQMGEALSAATTGRGLNQASSGYGKAQQDLVKSVIELEKAEQARQKTLLATERAERAVIATERAREQQSARSSKAIQVARDSNEAMSKTLENLRLGYNRLTAAERENANIGGVLKSRIQELDGQLKASDASIGKFQRNVGNYSGAVQGLGFSLRNIAGELPNLAISMRTFGQAISNNIGPAIEAFNNLSAENAKLRAEGKSTTSTLGIIGRSFFSLASIIPLVITAGFAFVEYLRKQESAADKAEKINKKYQETLNSIAESERSTAQEEIARANVLTSIAADSEQQMANRMRAVRELQKTYPDRFGALTKEAILEGNVASALRATTQELLNKAAAQAAEKRFAAASERVYDLDKARVEAAKELVKQQNYYERAREADLKLSTREAEMGKGSSLQALGTLNQARDSYVGIKNTLADARKEQQGFLADATKMARDAGATIFGSNPDAGAPKAKKPKKEREKKEPSDVNDVLKEQLGIYRALNLETNAFEATTQVRLEAYANTIATINTEEGGLMAQLAESYRLGEITTTEYEAERARIVEQYAFIRAQTTLNMLQREVDNEALSAEQRERIQKELTDANLTLAKLRSDAEERFVNESTKRQKRATKELEDALKTRERAYLDFTQSVKALGQELFDALNAFTDAGFQRTEDSLEKEKEDEDRRLENRLLDIERETNAGEERERRVAEAKAESAAIQDDIDRRREINEKKRAAAEKNFQAVQIGIEAAAAGARLAFEASIASAKALTALAATGGVPNPASIAYAGAATYAYAQIGVVAGIAAARIAALYAYAEGTDNHPGGRALIGEGGQPELVKEPGKSPYWVTAPIIKDLPEKSKVIPLDKMVQWDMLTPSLMRSLSAQTGLNSSDLGAHLAQHAKRLERAIRSNKTTVTVTGMSPGFRKQVRGSC